VLEPRQLGTRASREDVWMKIHVSRSIFLFGCFSCVWLIDPPVLVPRNYLAPEHRGRTLSEWNFNFCNRFLLASPVLATSARASRENWRLNKINHHVERPSWSDEQNKRKGVILRMTLCRIYVVSTVKRPIREKITGRGYPNTASSVLVLPLFIVDWKVWKSMIQSCHPAMVHPRSEDLCAHARRML
jgi:hypothetical protein